MSTFNKWGVAIGSFGLVWGLGGLLGFFTALNINLGEAICSTVISLLVLIIALSSTRRK